MQALLYMVFTILTSEGVLETHTVQAEYRNMYACKQGIDLAERTMMAISPQLGEEVIIRELKCEPVKTTDI